MVTAVDFSLLSSVLSSQVPVLLLRISVDAEVMGLVALLVMPRLCDHDVQPGSQREIKILHISKFGKIWQSHADASQPRQQESLSK